MFRLVQPSLKYKNSYVRAVRHMERDDLGFAKNYSADDLPGQIKKWRQWAKDDVAYRYWLVDNKEYLGTIRLGRRGVGPYPGFRGHISYSISPTKRKKGYGTLILQLGLKKAKTLGFQNVIITCKETNIASRKIIETNGGKFLKSATVQGDYEPITLMKYTIKLAEV